MATPTVALCLIARDESWCLRGCLESVVPLVDQMIVVDTGSHDDTPAIAGSFGATVVRHPWRDDFSDARNAAVSHARCDWVLVLDADERLAPGAPPAVRRAIATAAFDCGLVRVHDAADLDARAEDVIAGHARLAYPALLPRLLRRTPDLRWRGIVHEDLADWVTAGHRAQGLDVDVIHLGRVPSVIARKGKSARNRRLLERRCDKEPDDPVPFGYLASELMEAGETAAARTIAERGWRIVERGHGVRSVARLATVRAVLQLGEGDLDGARETATRAQLNEPDNPDLSFLEGQAHEALAMKHPPASSARRAGLEAALAAYQRALLPPGPFVAVTLVEGVRGWGTRTRLATVALLLGDAQQALAAFESALAERPQHREAQLGRIEALIATGQAARALSEVKTFLDESPDGWWLAARAAHALGSPEQAQVLERRAAERAPAGFVGRHRTFPR